MSRTSSLFFLLLILLVFLLYFYETNSVRKLTKLRSRQKSIMSSSSSLGWKSLESSSSIQEQDSSLSSLKDSDTNSSNLVAGPVQVIILARMRTGSTLCGEILNQNPDMFFIFEPLHTLKGLRFMLDSRFTLKNYREECTNLLRKLYRCKFPRMFIESFSRWGIGKGKSKSLTSLCRRTDGCKKASPSQFESRCSLSGHVATKTIRADIKMVRPLIKVHNVNLKIIHLIRDPRGTASSRQSYYSPKSRDRSKTYKKSLQELGLLSTSPSAKKNTIPMLCDWMKETLNDVLDRPPWTRDHYRLVRYEDLAREPMRLSRAIYDFIGLEMPPVVSQWIQNNTESNNDRSNRQFSTHKNSSQAATSWRGKLP